MLEVQKCWAPRVQATYAIARSREEQSVDMQGEDNKKRGEGGREWQHMHREIMIQDQRAKAAISWAMVRRVKCGLIIINTWSVNKDKGDNYVVISLWLVTSLVHCFVMAPTNLAFKELLKMAELVR